MKSTADLRVEALKDFLDSPGWAIFTAHIQQEWGAGGQRFEGTINTFADSREEDHIVLQQIRQIAVARREILRLLQWPIEELTRLSSTPVSDDPRRPMEPALAGQSRRGGL